MKRITWSRLAAEDLERIGAYLHEKSPVAVQKVTRLLYQGCHSLAELPLRGRKSRMPGNHELVFTDLPYIAVYRLSGNQVEIIRIYHSAQHWL